MVRNSRNGLQLFAVYCLLYGAFVLMNAFWPDSMGWTVWGITLAVVYGLVLIVAALVLALVYAWQCCQPMTTKAEVAE